jgi:hypothetical protein
VIREAAFTCGDQVQKIRQHMIHGDMPGTQHGGKVAIFTFSFLLINF